VKKGGGNKGSEGHLSGGTYFFFEARGRAVSEYNRRAKLFKKAVPPKCDELELKLGSLIVATGRERTTHRLTGREGVAAAWGFIFPYRVQTFTAKLKTQKDRKKSGEEKKKKGKENKGGETDRVAPRKGGGER